MSRATAQAVEVGLSSDTNSILVADCSVAVSSTEGSTTSCSAEAQRSRARYTNWASRSMEKHRTCPTPNMCTTHATSRSTYSLVQRESSSSCHLQNAITITFPCNHINMKQLIIDADCQKQNLVPANDRNDCCLLSSKRCGAQRFCLQTETQGFSSSRLTEE